jgi:hypothetical protein
MRHFAQVRGSGHILLPVKRKKQQDLPGPDKKFNKAQSSRRVIVESTPPLPPPPNNIRCPPDFFGRVKKHFRIIGTKFPLRGTINERCEKLRSCMAYAVCPTLDSRCTFLFFGNRCCTLFGLCAPGGRPFERSTRATWTWQGAPCRVPPFGLQMPDTTLPCFPFTQQNPLKNSTVASQPWPPPSTLHPFCLPPRVRPQVRCVGLLGVAS